MLISPRAHTELRDCELIVLRTPSPLEHYCAPAPSPAQPWPGPFFRPGSALYGHFGKCSRRNKVRKNGFLRPHWSQKAQKVASHVRACHFVKNSIPGAPYLPAASPEAGKTCPRDGDAGSHGASTAITIAHHLAGAAYTRWALLKASSTRH